MVLLVKKNVYFRFTAAIANNPTIVALTVTKGDNGVSGREAGL